MLLIHSTRLGLTEFSDSTPPGYAILSHCWDDQEVLYQEFVDSSSAVLDSPCDMLAHKGWRKIMNCCSLAREAGIEWVWIDTCCIDKKSSSELSEAINCMFRYYEGSIRCFVILPDLVISGMTSTEMDHKISTSRWFKRGWTLQELIAPKEVDFYDANASYIGTRDSLTDLIVETTKIPVEYLNGTSQYRDASVAQRMSWASGRSTKREEDTAYCLLGLFDVNIPLLYGEGKKAFHRLQHAIISQLDDESVFAWTSSRERDRRGMLADSPSEFAATARIRPVQFEHKRPPVVLTSRGLELHYAYSHPAEGAWEKLSGSLFGRPLVPQFETIPLRLDCELTTQQGAIYWVGISLCHDPVTGNWFRYDASKLIYARQNTFFKRLYPAFMGSKKIYVESSKSHSSPSVSSPERITTSGARVRTVTVKYDRPMAISLLSQFFELLSYISWLWVISAVHHYFALVDPSPSLQWAYLTGSWWLQGQHVSYLFAILVVGILGHPPGSDMYASRSIFSAFLGFVPMHGLQLLCEMVFWKDSRIL